MKKIPTGIKSFRKLRKENYYFVDKTRMIKDFLESRLMNYSNGNLEDIVDSISFLMDKLKDYYHKEVMVFIDEYDTPFIEAHTKGFYEEVRGGLSGLLHNSLKTSNSLKYAFITGIQRVAKENIFSDLNNLVVCDVTDQRYAAYFGFDSDETKELLEYYGLELNYICLFDYLFISS